MGRPIPDIREDMYALSDELAAAGYAEWCIRLFRMAEDTYRNPPVRQAPVTSYKMTKDRATAIRLYARDNPTTSVKVMANLFGVNQGRISEALNMKR
jgi:hypothetical protein